MASSTSTDWHVELDLFRGPLHTLLDLVERHELPVTGVSLVAVADQYLELVRQMRTLDLDLTAEFLHLAARLLLLKSVALLPHAAEAEPGDAVDVEDDLEARLLAYRRYRDAARALATRYDARARVFVPEARLPQPAGRPEGVLRIDPMRLRRAMARVEGRRRAVERARAAAPSPLIPFPQVLRAVVERLRGRRTAAFHDLSREASDVVTAITMFLAVLELARLRRLSLHQGETFGPIELRMEP